MCWLLMAPDKRFSHTLDSLGWWPRPACSFRIAQTATLLEFHVPLTNCFDCGWFCVVHVPKPPLHCHNYSVLANSKTQNAFLVPAHAIFRHDWPLAVKPASTPRRLVHKKLGKVLYLLICFLLCLSCFLRSRVRKFRRNFLITLYMAMAWSQKRYVRNILFGPPSFHSTTRPYDDLGTSGISCGHFSYSVTISQIFCTILLSKAGARYLEPLDYRSNNGCKTVTGSVLHPGCYKKNSKKKVIGVHVCYW